MRILEGVSTLAMLLQTILLRLKSPKIHKWLLAFLNYELIMLLTMLLT